MSHVQIFTCDVSAFELLRGVGIAKIKEDDIFEQFLSETKSKNDQNTRYLNRK
jgi:hypothetical protein